MDYQRYLLIGAIAVLSYMLLIEWSIFKEDISTQKVTAEFQQRSQAETQPPTAIAGDSNQTVDAVIPNESEISRQVADADIPQIEQPKTETAIASTSLISVSTDSLVINIDPVGGDIVFAALPRHFAKLDTPDIPFVLLENSDRRTYIAQSGLIGTNGTDTSKGRPFFSASTNSYEMADDQDSLTVDLIHTTDSGVKITKRFSFSRGSYLVDINYLIDNQTNQPWSAAMFGQLKRDNSEDPAAENSGMGMAPFLGAATTLIDEPYKKLKFDDFEDKSLKHSKEGGWIALVQHYFISAWIPNKATQNNFSTIKTNNGFNIARFTSPAVLINPGQQGEINAQFYAGPKDQYTLEEISPGLELTVDYSWLWWIAQPLFWLLTKIYGYVGNWGVAIIGVTLLVKILFFQLNAKAYKSMASMRKVQPKLLEIRERYADDKAKQSQEMMNLYKKEGINPLGGCLPILVQMPVFIALYWVLMESVELRHAPFALWIEDLSVMDPFFVLPLIMGASMFIQQKLNPPPPDPLQAKIMQWMPVMFTFFFLFFPAGLVLYWVVNNVLSIAQQYIITKRIENS